MCNIQWKIRTFQELTINQLFDLLQLRVNVFVVEQQCAYSELDEHDRHAETRHLSGYDAVGSLVAYTRLLPAGLSFSEVSMGRFVVRKERRSQGIGHQLLRTALKEILQCWPGRSIKISAQTYLEQFYAQYGFTRVSETYLDEGVSHIEMLKES